MARDPMTIIEEIQFHTGKVHELWKELDATPTDHHLPKTLAPKPEVLDDTDQLVASVSGGQSALAHPKTPPPAEEDDTDALVASLSGGQSPPAQVKTSPPATKGVGEFDWDAICAEVVSKVAL
jgi:hypothetical protein